MKFERLQPKVSIVIASWFRDGQNGHFGENETYNIAKECLKRLIEVTPRELYELILVDNGSTFGKDYFDSADILIRNPENLGFAPGYNQGINLARGEYVIAMNNDILLWEGWLDTMIKDFEDNENSFNPPIGLLMPAIVKDKIKFWDAIKLKKEDIDMNKNAGSFTIQAEFGSLWMGRRNLFRDIANNRDGYQVLDENFKLGMGEDRWLYREVRMKGKETYRTHNLRVLHVGNVTISKFDNRKEYTFKNREYLESLKKEYNIV